MDPIVLAAGTALVTAMATDTWQQVREGMVALWRRVRPGQAVAVETDLTRLHEQILAARRDGDDDTERALARSWQARLRLLLGEEPALACDLRGLLEEWLVPAPAGPVTMNAVTGAHGRIYQAARDQHITG